MKEQLRLFFDYLRLNRNASAHTVAAYEGDIGQFLAFTADSLGKPAGSLEPDDLDLGAIRTFMGQLHRQGHARASVARKLSALRALGRFLRREGWIEVDPASPAVAPKREQKTPAPLPGDVRPPPTCRGARWRASSRCPPPQTHSGAGTGRSSSCSTRRACASASWSVSISRTSTSAPASCASWARGPRNGSCRSTPRPLNR